MNNQIQRLMYPILPDTVVQYAWRLLHKHAEGISLDILLRFVAGPLSQQSAYSLTSALFRRPNSYVQLL